MNATTEPSIHVLADVSNGFGYTPAIDRRYSINNDTVTIDNLTYDQFVGVLTMLGFGSDRARLIVAAAVESEGTWLSTWLLRGLAS